MPTATATRQRLTSAAITLHHPLDYYFAQFLRAKKTEGLKSRTLNDHESHYRYLQRWLTEKHPTLKLEELTADHVRKYVQHMLTEQTLYTGHPTLESHSTAKALSPATVNIRTRTLKCFLRFLHDEGYLQTDLASRVKLQKVKENTIGAFEKEQVLQLGNKNDELWQFLNDLSYYGNTHGNNKGNVFGIEKTVMVYQPTPDKKDVYGKDGARKAEVRGRKVLLIKITNAIQTLHSMGIKNKYDEKMLMPIIMSYFQDAQANDGDGLVLAPQGYRVAGGRYTAFNWEEVKELFNFVEGLQADANIKQAAIELARGMDEKDESNEGEEAVKH